jgi:uracil-DNA glycosylase family protein
MCDAPTARVAVRAKKPDLAEFPGARAFLPVAHTLPALRAAVQTCRGCPLYKFATQAVFGEGTRTARVMLIGEVPGDREDLEGQPFVGPAGRLLDEALAEAKIPRGATYVTNAVKHFKYTQRGKRRIHDKPNRYEITACKPWLGEELAVVKPEIVLLLGATAAQALLGSAFRVTKSRGELITDHEDIAPYVIATVHPASVLRAPDEIARATARADFIADVVAAGELYATLPPR